MVLVGSQYFRPEGSGRKHMGLHCRGYRTRRSILPAIDRTGKCPVWSVKMDLVSDMQDVKTLCILAPAQLAGDCCVVSNAVDCCVGIAAGDYCVEPSFRLVW